MTSSTVAGTARTYTYNGDGLLQTRTGGVGASFLWDSSSSPGRELKQGNDNTIYGLGPLYVVKADATTLTFARDGGKSVRGEVNSTGAVTAASRYRGYGQLAQSTIAGPTYLGFASQLLDPSGLYYMQGLAVSRRTWLPDPYGLEAAVELQGAGANQTTIRATFRIPIARRVVIGALLLIFVGLLALTAASGVDRSSTVVMIALAVTLLIILPLATRLQRRDPEHLRAFFNDCFPDLRCDT
jgi:hypothetical protein